MASPFQFIVFILILVAVESAGIGDKADMETVYETEWHLLYVACARARDR